MGEFNQHSHDFLPNEWPFKAPSNAIAFSTVRVTQDLQPILMVYHDHDDSWQFHCGFIKIDDKPSLFCLGCIYRLDPTVGLVADLPVGWMASRETICAPWKREPFKKDENDCRPV